MHRSSVPYRSDDYLLNDYVLNASVVNILGNVDTDANNNRSSFPGIFAEATIVPPLPTLRSPLTDEAIFIPSNPPEHSAPPDPSTSAIAESSEISTGSGDANTPRPGAFQVTRTPIGAEEVYRVAVPNDVLPGSEFTVHAGTRLVCVRCPPSSKPNQLLEITIRQRYLVTIPPNISPGMTFIVNVAGQRVMVNCPESAGPGMRVRIVPPIQRDEPEAAPNNQIFEVAVPAGVQPGQPFPLVANGNTYWSLVHTMSRRAKKYVSNCRYLKSWEIFKSSTNPKTPDGNESLESQI